MRVVFLGLLGAALLQDGEIKREGKGARREKLDAMEGKAAPAWEFEEWVQGETDLEKLKGKVVLIDFWGVW
jgi:hypothetical protein